MKKILFIVLCVFLCMPVVYAAPKKNTRSLDTIKITKTDKEYEKGEKLFLDFKMVTDTSNVENVLLLFESANHSSSFLSNIQDLSGNSYIVIPKNIESNFYIISRLTINYKDGSSTLYSKTGIEPLSNKYDFGTDYIFIGSSSNEISVKIKSVKFTQESVISGSSQTLSVVLDQEMDIDTTNTFAIITNGVNVKRINLNGNKTNTLTGTVILTGTETTYYLDSITIADKNNNSKTTYYKNEEINKKSFCNEECLDTLVSFRLENNTTEEETPILSTVKFNKTVTSSTAKIFVDATDSGSGINSTTVTLYRIGDDGVIDLNSKITTNLYYDNLLEEYVGTINFNNKPQGKYYIFRIELLDNLNTAKEVCLNDCDLETIVNLNTYKYDTIEYKEDTNEVLSIKDSDLVSKIKESQEDTIIVDISSSSIVAKEVFAAIQNTNKTLVLKDSGIEWIFKGNDIEKLKEVDLSFRTSMYDKKEIGKNFIALELSDYGSLPGKVKVRINSLYTYQYEKGKDKVNIYYTNGNKYSEIVTNISVTEDGYYEFEISKTGTYLLSEQRISESLLSKDDDVEEDTKKEKRVTPKKKDNNLLIGIIIGIPLVFLIVVIIIYCVKTVRMRKNSLENYVVDDPIVATPLEDEEFDEDEEVQIMKYKSKGNH